MTSFENIKMLLYEKKRVFCILKANRPQWRSAVLCAGFQNENKNNILAVMRRGVCSVLRERKFEFSVFRSIFYYKNENGRSRKKKFFFLILFRFFFIRLFHHNNNNKWFEFI